MGQMDDYWVAGLFDERYVGRLIDALLSSLIDSLISPTTAALIKKYAISLKINWSPLNHLKPLKSFKTFYLSGESLGRLKFRKSFQFFYTILKSPILFLNLRKRHGPLKV